MNTSPSPKPSIPTRDPRGHKGTFGTVVIAGGCCAGANRMLGAPALAALAALRSGAGLARIHAPAPIVDAILTIAPTATGRAIPVNPDSREIMAEHAAACARELVAGADALVLGPGLGHTSGVVSLVLESLGQSGTPIILDADGLNALAEVPDREAITESIRSPLIVTPHPGEFNRLARALELKGDPTDYANTSARADAAKALATALRAVVVLKGAATVVTDGARVWTNSTGSSALATGGSGDILAGIIAGLVAQHVNTTPQPSPTKPLDLFAAACAAVYAHGEAADLWCRQNVATSGMLATDLLNWIPLAIQRLRGS